MRWDTGGGCLGIIVIGIFVIYGLVYVGEGFFGRGWL